MNEDNALVWAVQDSLVRLIELGFQIAHHSVLILQFHFTGNDLSVHRGQFLLQQSVFGLWSVRYCDGCCTRSQRDSLMLQTRGTRSVSLSGTVSLCITKQSNRLRNRSFLMGFIAFVRVPTVKSPLMMSFAPVDSFCIVKTRGKCHTLRRWLDSKYLPSATAFNRILTCCDIKWRSN